MDKYSFAVIYIFYFIYFIQWHERRYPLLFFCSQILHIPHLQGEQLKLMLCQIQVCVVRCVRYYVVKYQTLVITILQIFVKKHWSFKYWCLVSASDLLTKTWRLYKLSPLYKFNYSKLRQYQKLLGGHVQAVSFFRVLFVLLHRVSVIKLNIVQFGSMKN